MENQKNVVTEQVTEAVAEATEETPKTYTQEQVEAIVKGRLDDILPRRISRAEEKGRREAQRDVNELLGILQAGTGKKSIPEITEAFRHHYGANGVKQPEQPKYAQEDLEVLATADADGIIRGGDDEVAEEIQRLQKLGTGMTDREKLQLQKLESHRHVADRNKALERLGVTADTYNSKEFRDFAKMFAAETPIEKVWEQYAKTTKKEFKTMGSMKNTPASKGGLKDFYTPEEAAKISKEDYLRNPGLMKRVEESAAKWK